MNIAYDLSGLSGWVYFWFVSIIIAWLLSFIWLWQFSLCCLLFVIPFGFFIFWWNRNRMHCSLNHAIRSFLNGFINITLLAVFAQFLGLFLLALFFAGTHIIFYSLGNLAFILMSITYYVTVEEVLKLYFSVKSRDSVQDPMNQITKSHTITSTATGLGYSMSTGILWTIFVAISLNKDDKKDHERYSLFGWLFLITLIIAVVGMPMHLITGYVMGCKITQRDIEFSQNNQDVNDQEDVNDNHNRLPFASYLNVVYYSIFIRSSYLFFLFIGFLVIQFNIGGVLIAIFGIIIDYILLIKHAKKTESSLPPQILERVRPFGYNILAGNDPRGDDDEYNDYEPNQVQVTTISLDNFGANLDEPMVVGSNNKNDNDNHDEVEEEMRYKSCNLDNDDEQNDEVEIHVNDSILDDDEISSDQDTQSTVR